MAPVVEIYSDRLTITSYGGLVSGLSLEEFYNGRSMPKNRELMRVFRDLELVEQLGSGMHRILKVYDRAIFSISDNFLEICFPYTDDYLEYVKSENVIVNPEDVIVNPESDPVKPEDVIVNLENSIINLADVPIKLENGTINSTDVPIKLENGTINSDDDPIKLENGIVNPGDVIVNTKKEILEIIEKNNGIKIFEIANILNKSTRTVKRYIKQLRDEEKIKYIGALKTGGYYIVNSEDDK